MTEDQLEDLGVNEADALFATLDGNREDLHGAILYLIARVADKLVKTHGLVEGVGFLFALDESIDLLTEEGEKKIIEDFKDRGPDLIAKLLKL